MILTFFDKKKSSSNLWLLSQKLEWKTWTRVTSAHKRFPLLAVECAKIHKDKPGRPRRPSSPPAACKSRRKPHHGSHSDILMSRGRPDKCLQRLYPCEHAVAAVCDTLLPTAAAVRSQSWPGLIYKTKAGCYLASRTFNTRLDLARWKWEPAGVRNKHVCTPFSLTPSHRKGQRDHKYPMN